MALQFDKNIITENQVSKESIDFSLENKPLDQKVKLLILRDLWNINWQVDIKSNKLIVTPPEYYDKETIRNTMALKRQEIIDANRDWIDKHIKYARFNLACGWEVINSKIKPAIEVCESQKQHDLFRIFRYYWSSPYSEYVGRRIKLLIRDKALPHNPVIGIAALGSPIIHIPERDSFIGWDKETRTKNLIYTMDAYVIGAVPPYNHLLGGKLISYLLASNEVRKIYRDKYKDKVTLIDKRTSDKLIGIFTTSLYGKSSQYNRLNIDGRHLYQEIGKTKGFGSLHLSDQTIRAMVELLREKDLHVNNNFGDGPSWVMRVIRSAGELAGFDPDFLLRHSFKRNIYFVPLAKNYDDVLNGRSNKPVYFHYSKNQLVNHWKTRWLEMRKRNPEVFRRVTDFVTADFEI